MITQSFNVPIVPVRRGPSPVVCISQYDMGARVLEATITDQLGTPFELPTGATATLVGTKPDGNAFSYAADVSGSTVTMDVTEQMSVVFGNVPCEIRLADASGSLGTANFILWVEKSPFNEGAVSESDVPVFEQLASAAAASAAAAAADRAHVDEVVEDMVVTDDIVNNYTTTEAGFVLDGRVGVQVGKNRDNFETYATLYGAKNLLPFDSLTLTKPSPRTYTALLDAPIPAGTYKLTFNVTGTDPIPQTIIAFRYHRGTKTEGQVGVRLDIPGEKTLVFTQDVWQVHTYITTSTTDGTITATDMMLRPAILEDTTFAPHAMTVSGLTRMIELPGFNNAFSHNGIYRGKNLGTSVTAEQYAEIAAGTFRDMYIGDYWSINGKTWVIAGFNYWLNTGSEAISTPHVVIVPYNLYTHAMNDTATIEGAYTGSDMYKTGLAQAKTMINEAFGAEHILTRNALLPSAVDNNEISATQSVTSTVDLMSEQMAFGVSIYGAPTKRGTNGGHTYDKTILPLFALNPRMLCLRSAWWLRNPAYGTDFCIVNGAGSAAYASAATACGVRPCFGLIG